MFYDLNVPWNSNEAELQQRISFLAELGYNVLALSHLLPDKLPATIISPITLPSTTSTRNLRLLTRCTVPLTTTASNPSNLQLADLRTHYSIIAVKPFDEKTITQACTTLEIDIISLDLARRYPFHFRPGIFSAALARGIKLELCYGQAILSGDSEQRRCLVQNASAIIRSTRGKGIVISSEAAGALGCRGPHDVVNLALIWGLKQDVAREAVDEAPRTVVAAAQLRRRAYRATVDVVDGGTRPEPDVTKKGAKRKADEAPEKVKQPMSKRAMKRMARKPHQEAEPDASSDKNNLGGFAAGAEISTASDAAKDVT